MKDPRDYTSLMQDMQAWFADSGLVVKVVSKDDFDIYVPWSKHPIWFQGTDGGDSWFWKWGWWHHVSSERIAWHEGKWAVYLHSGCLRTAGASFEQAVEDAVQLVEWYRQSVRDSHPARRAWRWVRRGELKWLISRWFNKLVWYRIMQLRGKV